MRQLHVQKTLILNGEQAQLSKWAKKLQQQCSKLNYRARRIKKENKHNENSISKRKQKSYINSKLNPESEEEEVGIDLDDIETETDDEIAMIMSKVNYLNLNKII